MLIYVQMLNKARRLQDKLNQRIKLFSFIFFADNFWSKKIV